MTRRLSRDQQAAPGHAGNGLGVPLSPYPDWYTPSTSRRAANLRVVQGRHPFGLTLGPETSTCGTCRHAYVKSFGKRYWKCRLTRQSRGPSTDLVKSWRGCSLWEAP